MKNFVKPAFFLAVTAILASGFALAQQVKRTDFDVTTYVMDVALSPVENKLTATADVTFIPLEDARTFTFELNGSLKVDSIVRISGGAGMTPVQATI